MKRLFSRKTKEEVMADRLAEQKTAIQGSYSAEGKKSAYNKIYAVCKAWSYESLNGAIAAALLASSFYGTALTQSEYEDIMSVIPIWLTSSFPDPKLAEPLRSLAAKHVEFIRSRKENYSNNRRVFIEKGKTSRIPDTDEELGAIFDQWDTILLECELKGTPAAITLAKQDVDYWIKRMPYGPVHAITLVKLLLNSKLITQQEHDVLIDYIKKDVPESLLPRSGKEKDSTTSVVPIETKENSYASEKKRFIDNAMENLPGTVDRYAKVYDQWHDIRKINEVLGKESALVKLRACIDEWCSEDSNGMSYSGKLIETCAPSMLTELEKQELIRYSVKKHMDSLSSIRVSVPADNNTSYEEKLKKVYGSFNQALIGKVFHGGLTQADVVLRSLADIYGKNLNELDEDQYNKILKTYIDVYIRNVIVKCTHTHIITSLLTLHSDLVLNKDIARKVLSYTVINIINNDASMADKKIADSVKMMAGQYAEMEEAAKLNADKEDAFLNDPEYGLVPEKPIYTQGVTGSNEYLEKLRIASGEELKWTRTHTTTSPEVIGIIDVYEGKLPSGKVYNTLYLNMYGSKNSITIPQGFTCEE